MNLPECSRCKKQKPEYLVIHERSNPGFMWGGLPDGDLATPQGPTYRTTCYDCITDDEVSERLLGVVGFVLDVLVVREKNKLGKRDTSLLQSLSYLGAYIAFRLSPYRNYRSAAIAALRSTAQLIDQVRGYHRCIQCAAFRHESELY